MSYCLDWLTSRDHMRLADHVFSVFTLGLTKYGFYADRLFEGPVDNSCAP